MCDLGCIGAAFAGMKTIAKNPLSWPRKIGPKIKRAASRVSAAQCFAMLHLGSCLPISIFVTGGVSAVLGHCSSLRGSSCVCSCLLPARASSNSPNCHNDASISSYRDGKCLYAYPPCHALQLLHAVLAAQAYFLEATAEVMQLVTKWRTVTY